MRSEGFHPFARAALPARWGRLLAVAWAVVLGGCAVALPKLPQHVPDTWQHAATAAAAPEPDLRGWWKAFDDPLLDRLVDAALADNPGLGEALLRLESARLLAQHAGSPYRPQLSAHTYAEPTPDSSASYFQAGFDARWELALFGRGESARRVAAGTLGGAEAMAAAAKVSVVAEVVRSHVELRAAEQRLALLGEALRLAEDRARLVATRERLQLASGIELEQARGAVAQAEAALAEPRLAIDTTLQQLAVLTGRERPDPAWGASPRALSLGEVALAEAPADLLRTRPEIRRAEGEVLKAAGELGLARADRFPRIGLGGSLTYSAKVVGNSHLSDADSIVTFGPAIDIPLFDWGMRQAAADAREKDLAAALLAYRHAVLQGIGEAETALAALARHAVEGEALARAVEAHRRAVAVSAELRRLGLADDFARSDAAGGLLAVQLAALDATRERSLAFVALYKALGGAPLPDGVR
ncbi:MAG: TolC family protein [Xanthomonadales bacterium]|nr:TolC family protein [Xanthomonadales bacterium]